MSNVEPIVDGQPSPATAEDLSTYCRVDWARVNLPLRVLAMVQRPFGVYLHWRGKANLLCPTSIDLLQPCEWCKDTSVKKAWYACILGHCLRTSDTVLMLIPDHSYHRCATRLNTGDLTGRVITATRAHNYSTVTIEVSRSPNRLTVAPLTVDQFRGIIERVYARMPKSTLNPKGEENGK